MANLSNINNKFLVTDGGKVGIGITAPTGILHTDQTFSGYAPVTFKNSVTNQGQFVELITSTDEGSKYTGIESISLQTGNGWKVWGGGNNFGEMYLSVGGAHAIVIQNNLKVGIGTDSPDYKLHVSDTSIDTLLRVENSSVNKYPHISLKASAKEYHIGVGGASAVTGYANNLYFYDNTTAAIRMVIDTNGNVGIGTDSPTDLYANQLVVKCSSSENGITILSNSTTDANYLMFADGASGSNRFRGQIIYNHQDNFMAFATEAVEKMRIDSSGNTTITTTSNQGGLTVTSATDNTVIGINNTATNGQAWRLQSTGNTSGLGAGKLFLKVSTTETAANLISFITDSSGNNIKMGIGTTDPGAKIDIKGVSGSPATSGTTQNGILRIQNASNNNTLDIGQPTASPFGTWLQAADKSDLNPAYTYPILLNPLGGNVGIGTTSPAAGSQLTLRSSGSTGITILSASNTGECFINFSDNDDANVGQIFYGHSPDRMAFRVGDDTRVTILGSNGNVGIGMTSPDTKLNIASGGVIRVNSSSTSAKTFLEYYYNGSYNHGLAAEGDRGLRMYSSTGDNSAKLTFFTEGTERMLIGSTGRIQMTGLDGKTQVHPDVSYRTSDGELFYQTSSIRYKKDIVNLENSLNKINSLRPVRFTDINTNEPSFGLIAEETNEIIPDVVFTKDEQIEGISYSNLTPFLIKAIQELKAEIELLKNK